MNKIIVNGSFLKRRVTGVARYAREITTRILEKENIFIACDQAAHPELEPGKVFHVPQSWATKILGTKAWNQFDLPRYIGSSVLWSPENIGPLGIVNHVVTVHDLSPLDHPEWFRPSVVAVYRFYLPRLIRQARVVLTVSEYFRNRILKQFQIPEAQVSVIPCAVDARFHPCTSSEAVALRQRYNLPEQYILSLGSLEPRKNIRNLLAAWKRLPPEVHDNVSLVVTGDRGDVFAEQDHRSQISQIPGVIFTGYLADQDLPALYSAASGLVYPSLYEGFGLPPLEAMACGTPVITCRNTALPEVVGESALFVDPCDPDSIAAAIQLVIKDRGLRSHLSQVGLDRAKQFSWDKSADRVYGKLSEISQKN